VLCLGAFIEHDDVNAFSQKTFALSLVANNAKEKSSSRMNQFD